MCAAAIFYTGIGRVVYGLSAAAILHLRNAQPHTAGLSLSCRAVLAERGGAGGGGRPLPGGGGRGAA